MGLGGPVVIVQPATRESAQQVTDRFGEREPFAGRDDVPQFGYRRAAGPRRGDGQVLEGDVGQKEPLDALVGDLPPQS